MKRADLAAELADALDRLAESRRINRALREENKVLRAREALNIQAADARAFQKMSEIVDAYEEKLDQKDRLVRLWRAHAMRQRARREAERAERKVNEDA